MHAIQSNDLQELEQVDFQRQQDERPWAVPTKSRQTMVDDLASWWSTYPHARKGREMLQITGLSNALPLMKRAGVLRADGSYIPAEFEHVAREDHLISRVAAKVWQNVNMGRARAEAMAVVQEKYDRGELTQASDLMCCLDDESEPENEVFDGIEVAVKDLEPIDQGTDSEGEPVDNEDALYFDDHGDGGEAPRSRAVAASPALGDRPNGARGDGESAAASSAGGEAPRSALIAVKQELEGQIGEDTVATAKGARHDDCISSHTFLRATWMAYMPRRDMCK